MSEVTQETLDALKLVGKEIGEVASSIQNALDDKKINLGEGIGIAKDVGTFGFAVIKHRESLKSLVDGASQQEIDAFNGGFRIGYDITNDATEESVEMMLRHGSSLIVGLIGMIFSHKEKKEVVEQAAPVNMEAESAPVATPAENVPEPVPEEQKPVVNTAEAVPKPADPIAEAPQVEV